MPACLFPPFARDEERSQSKASHKKVTFNLSGDEDSEGEDMEDIFGGKSPSSAKTESKSSFEKRQEKVISLKLKGDRQNLLIHWLNFRVEVRSDELTDRLQALINQSKYSKSILNTCNGGYTCNSNGCLSKFRFTKSNRNKFERRKTRDLWLPWRGLKSFFLKHRCTTAGDFHFWHTVKSVECFRDRRQCAHFFLSSASLNLLLQQQPVNLMAFNVSLNSWKYNWELASVYKLSSQRT